MPTLNPHTSSLRRTLRLPMICRPRSALCTCAPRLVTGEVEFLQLHPVGKGPSTEGSFVKIAEECKCTSRGSDTRRRYGTAVGFSLIGAQCRRNPRGLPHVKKGLHDKAQQTQFLSSVNTVTHFAV